MTLKQVLFLLLGYAGILNAALYRLPVADIQRRAVDHVLADCVRGRCRGFGDFAFIARVNKRFERLGCTVEEIIQHKMNIIVAALGVIVHFEDFDEKHDYYGAYVQKMIDALVPRAAYTGHARLVFDCLMQALVDNEFEHPCAFDLVSYFIQSFDCSCLRSSHFAILFNDIRTIKMYDQYKEMIRVAVRRGMDLQGRTSEGKTLADLLKGSPSGYSFLEAQSLFGYMRDSCIQFLRTL